MKGLIHLSGNTKNAGVEIHFIRMIPTICFLLLYPMVVAGAFSRQ